MNYLAWNCGRFLNCPFQHTIKKSNRLKTDTSVSSHMSKMAEYNELFSVNSYKVRDHTFFFSEFRFEGLELGLFAETARDLLPPLLTSNEPCLLEQKP